MRDANYITKMMILHIIIQDNSTVHWVGGMWKLFKYSELVSHHNCTKQLIDNCNNHCHAQIGLGQTWCTKCWPTRQFTFLTGIAKVNALKMQALFARNHWSNNWILIRLLWIKWLTIDWITAEQVTMPMLRKLGKGDGHFLTTWFHFCGRWDFWNK